MSGKRKNLKFYHGTDLDSALDILNNGLLSKHLLDLQSGRAVHLGAGWYTALDGEVAWYFAPLAPGNIGRGCAVIEMELSLDDFNDLVQQGLVIKSIIKNVLFVAEQYRFDPSCFDFLNEKAIFRPYQRGAI